ncbi:hypothetical protein SLS56_008301 [Neofusicoccum ribis]|uniref:Uncharacterized protein n=1 Tax=Neofusicoccum ribis TaxID=45134 RepID=A0ABR3SM09_9PEZI
MNERLVVDYDLALPKDGDHRQQWPQRRHNQQRMSRRSGSPSAVGSVLLELRAERKPGTRVFKRVSRPRIAYRHVLASRLKHGLSQSKPGGPEDARPSPSVASPSAHRSSSEHTRGVGKPKIGSDTGSGGVLDELDLCVGLGGLSVSEQRHSLQVMEQTQEEDGRSEDIEMEDGDKIQGK